MVYFLTKTLIGDIHLWRHCSLHLRLVRRIWKNTYGSANVWDRVKGDLLFPMSFGHFFKRCFSHSCTFIEKSRDRVAIWFEVECITAITGVCSCWINWQGIFELDCSQHRICTDLSGLFEDNSPHSLLKPQRLSRLSRLVISPHLIICRR